MAPDNTLIPESPDAGAAPEPSLRDELERAFEAAPTDDVREPPAAPAAPEGEPTRDAQGRFAPKGENAPAAPPEAAEAAAAKPAPAPPPGVTAPAPAPELKPPASWTPTAREKWAGVDPAVQAEIHRREREHGQLMEQAASARQFNDAFQRVCSPYEVLIRAEQTTPLQAVDSLLRSAAVMHVGSPEQKVGLVAGIIKQYGVDLHLLDSVLANAPLPAPGAGPMLDPRVDQLLAQQQAWFQQQQQTEQAGLQHLLGDFAATHEFYGDLRLVMADLIEMAGRRGDVLTMEDAYAKACKLDDGVSKILSTRASANSAGAQNAAAQRARRAALSITGDTTPAGATMPRDDSLRSTLEAAYSAAAQSAG